MILARYTKSHSTANFTEHQLTANLTQVHNALLFFSKLVPQRPERFLQLAMLRSSFAMVTNQVSLPA
jgi:hypothetical protein